MTTQKSQTEPKHISYAFELQDAYNKGFKEGKLQANTEHKRNIQLARECMNFKLIKCNNKDCLNESCPLWEKE